MTSMTSGRAGPRGLQALLRVRGQIAKQRELELGRAAAALQEAEVARAQAEQRCRAQNERLQDARHRTWQSSPAAAFDLQREQSWQARLAAELGGIEAKRDAERTALEERRQAFASAQQALVQAQAELEAVERVWQLWDEARRSDEQRRAEEELAEIAAIFRATNH